MNPALLVPLLLLPVAQDPAAVLVEGAIERLQAGDELAAYEELRDGLSNYLEGMGQGTPLEASHAEVAVLVLDTLTTGLDRQAELAQSLSTPDGLPPRVTFLLQRLVLRGLVDAGRFEEARALRDQLGYCTDLFVVGPFDNERGVGMRTAYPPESAVDLSSFLQGKEREVLWRELPVEPLDGRIELDALFRPREQAVAYLATAFHVAEARPVVLRLGSSSAVQVFHGGEVRFAGDTERPLRDDQDRVVLSLAAGWNTVLIKSGVEEGDWSLSLRLTDLAGEPLGADAVQVDSSRAGGPQGQAPELVARSAGEARDVFERAAEDAQAQRAYARYLLIVHPQDYTSDAAAEAARRAVMLEPDHVAGRFLLAETLLPRGRSRSEMALGPYLSELEGVLERDPDHVGALHALAEFYSGLMPMPDRLDTVTARLVEAAPDSPRALEARASALEVRGRDLEARLLRERAAETASMEGHTDAVLSRVRRERRAGRPDVALAILEEAFVRRPGDGLVARELADELADRGRAADFEEVLEAQLARRPFSIHRRLDAARMAEGLAAAGRPAAGPAPAMAERWVEEAHLIAPEDTEVLAWRARFALRRGDRAEAEAHLNEILRIDPGDDTVRRQVEFLGTEGAEARFETPWRSDALALRELPLPETGGNDPLEVLDRTTVYRVYADGGESRYEHVVWRPLTQAGIAALDRYGIIYPRSGALYVHNLRVIRADGTIERAPAPARRDLTQGELAMRPFDLPPVGVGDLVDVEYRIDETQPDVFGEYFGTAHSFYPERIDPLAPTRRSSLVVIAPPELPIHSHVRNSEVLEHTEKTDEAGNVIRSWIARDLARPTLESAMPRAEEFVPMVELTTYEDWQAFSTWWWSFIEKEFDTSEALRTKVAELTEGIESEAEKVAAIYRFVAQEIRYNAWAFGTHGYEPFSATTIFERRFGDCKDKSILLRQMLGEIGVEAVPVLIQAERFRPEEDLTLARVGHFNHCIAFVTPTAERAGYYLDATADRNPVEYLRHDDQGAKVLHVTPEGGELHEIPYADPEANALRRTWSVEVAADGGAQVTLRDESVGHYGVMLRYRYGGERGDIAKALAEEFSESFGAVEIESIETSELDLVADPAWLEARFRAEQLGTLEGPQRRLELAFDGLGLGGLAVEPSMDRVYDVVLDRPMRQETIVRYDLPEGAEISGLPPEVDIEAPGLVRYRLEVLREDRRVEVRQLFELGVQRVQQEDYAAFREAIEDVRVAEARTLGVRLAEPDGEAAGTEGGGR